MKLPAILRRRAAAARLPLFARCLATISLAACAAAFAPAAHAIEIQVEILIDSLAQPPAPLSNVCTLRKAVNNANDNLATYPQCQAGQSSGAPDNVVDEIVFNLPGTVTFTLGGAGEEGGETGDLDVTDSLIITGHPDGTTIDAADLDRVFHVHPGAVLTLRNIHITNGTGPGGGGGILIDGGTLNLENCTVSNSHAGGGDGGAILMNGGTLNMTNSTVSGNTAEHHSGAIHASGTVNITNSTVAGNASQTGLCGGISGTGVTLRSSVIAGNTNLSPINQIPNLAGTFTSLGYNVIGDLGHPDAAPSITPAQPTDQIGVTDAQLNLGALLNNGGPTPTRALGPGSVAIDAGHSSGSTSDQRGAAFVRPCDLASAANAAGGDGSDSGAYELQGVCAGGNQPPVAADDLATVAEDSGANAVAVLGNDTDPEADSLSVTAVTQGAHGSVAITGGGTGVSYTPNANYFGPDSFTYTASDGNGNDDTATVSVTVTPLEDAPVAAADAANVAEDSGANVVNVLANDADADGDALSVHDVTQGAHGTVANNGNSVSYTPAPDYFGPDSFTYTVTDGHGNFGLAVVSVNVSNVNDAPVANNDNYAMNQDGVLVVPAAGVLANDMDADGDSLTAVRVMGSGPNHGTVTLNPDGSFTYTPDAGFTGLDSFDYEAHDAGPDFNVATVTVKVNDTQGPAVNCNVTKAMLWPPNSDLMNVGLTVSASDNDGQPPAVQIDVFSDEDDAEQADGMSPDARDVGAGTLRLRAERRGDADGRVYVIRIRATDQSDNTSVAYCTVVVPHGQSKAAISAVNTQAAAAVAAFSANGDNPPAGFHVVGDGPTVGPKQ